MNADKMSYAATCVGHAVESGSKIFRWHLQVITGSNKKVTIQSVCGIGCETTRLRAFGSRLT